ncbi:unnamed protein product [Blepharisma stoltei]|uniref:Uncharacterized protein n=1 Tax=Blepharisma stoltei TaxID=1481888 RepID=A0AAU9IR86_9CILI|nr:unnamed protein product [Blepharisma stoltei]
MINQILRKIIASSRSESHCIQSEFNRIVKDLMINAFELALWALYLEKLPFRKLNKIEEELLIFSVFKAKSELVDDIQPYFPFLAQKRPEFKNKYLRWALANKKILVYTSNEINDKFKKLANTAYIDESFPDNININCIGDAYKELILTSSLTTFPNLIAYLNENEYARYKIKEYLASSMSSKRHKIQQDIEPNQYEEKYYFEIEGQVFVLEVIKQIKEEKEVLLFKIKGGRNKSVKSRNLIQSWLNIKKL